MSASSRLFQDERERHIIEVPDSFYREHLELLKYPKTRHIKTIVTTDEEIFKDDPIHASLLSDYVKSGKALRDYKYNKRNNFKK